MMEDLLDKMQQMALDRCKLAMKADISDPKESLVKRLTAVGFTEDVARKAIATSDDNEKRADALKDQVRHAFHLVLVI